ncbi:MAG: ATP-dependent zinc protease [Wenzhouxiangellaceae bacterium]
MDTNNQHDPLITIGAVEWVALPELGIRKLRARTDTGAASSALHVENIQEFSRDGVDWVRFDVITGTSKHWRRRSAEALVAGMRKVRNTSGEVETRYLIRTHLMIGGNDWVIDVNLTDRSNMRYRMLLGRSTMRNRVLVNPSRLYLQGKPQRQTDSDSD